MWPRRRRQEGLRCIVWRRRRRVQLVVVRVGGRCLPLELLRRRSLPAEQRLPCVRFSVALPPSIYRRMLCVFFSQEAGGDVLFRIWIRTGCFLPECRPGLLTCRVAERTDKFSSPLCVRPVWLRQLRRHSYSVAQKMCEARRRAGRMFGLFVPRFRKKTGGNRNSPFSLSRRPSSQAAARTFVCEDVIVGSRATATL